MGKLFMALYALFVVAMVVAVAKALDTFGLLSVEAIRNAADSGALPMSFDHLAILTAVAVLVIPAIMAVLVVAAVKFWRGVVKGLWFVTKGMWWSTKKLTKASTTTGRYIWRVVGEANNDGTQEYKVRRPAFYTRIWNTPTVQAYRDAVSDTVGEIRSEGFWAGFCREVKDETTTQMSAAIAETNRSIRRVVVFRLCRNRIVRGIVRLDSKINGKVASFLQGIAQGWRQASTETRLYVEAETDPIEEVPPYIRQRVFVFTKAFLSDVLQGARQSLRRSR